MMQVEVEFLGGPKDGARTHFPGSDDGTPPPFIEYSISSIESGQAMHANAEFPVLRYVREASTRDSGPAWLMRLEKRR